MYQDIDLRNTKNIRDVYTCCSILCRGTMCFLWSLVFPAARVISRDMSKTLERKAELAATTSEIIPLSEPFSKP